MARCQKWLQNNSPGGGAEAMRDLLTVLRLAVVSSRVQMAPLHERCLLFISENVRGKKWLELPELMDLPAESHLTMLSFMHTVALRRSHNY